MFYESHAAIARFTCKPCKSTGFSWQSKRIKIDCFGESMIRQSKDDSAYIRAIQTIRILFCHCEILCLQNRGNPPHTPLLKESKCKLKRDEFKCILIRVVKNRGGKDSPTKGKK